MTDTVSKRYAVWLENVNDPDLRRELVSVENDDAQINDRFYRELQFGTGGLRGRLGAGTNRMNIYTVGRASMGLADYIRTRSDTPSCVIAYDSRHMSAEFSRLAAGIFSSFGIRAYLFDTLTPTPVLSWAVRQLNATAGIVVTASHNPREYNGYKVYNEKGCQITDEAAALITAHIGRYDYFDRYEEKKDLITLLGREMTDRFIRDILTCSLPCDPAFYPSVVYTPLNGTGNLPVRALFDAMGFHDYTVVPSQKMPDGDFPTCPFPNPEERRAMAEAIALAEKKGARLVIATDPDADRVGIAERCRDGTYRLFSGNETGLLLLNFILSVKKSRKEIGPDDYIVKTIVTAVTAERIAARYGVRVVNVLTGFKYIGETIDRTEKGHYLFGMEESYGYLVGTHARDKDAISAVMSILQMAAHYAGQGRTLADALDGLYDVCGYESTLLFSGYFEGSSGMAVMTDFMDKLRRDPPKTLCGKRVISVTDYLRGADGLPRSNVIAIKGEGLTLIARPSGTEPKLKFYLSACADSRDAADRAVAQLRREAETLLDRFTVSG